MGNNPSAPAKSTNPSASSSSGSQSHNQQHESPKAVKRDIKHPIPVHHHRVAAPPEPSLAQAQGTTTTSSSTSSTSTARPKSFHIPSLGNHHASHSPSSTPASSLTRRVDVPSTTSPSNAPAAAAAPQEPARPVDVPQANLHGNDSSPSEPRSPFSELTTTTILQTNSLQDMSYLTRPPRLPLPIEEEVHTPGSPILVPTDLNEPLTDVDALDSDQNLRRVSGNQSQGDDEESELRVDKNRPTVPTKLEWHGVADKVYVTGTIFQWNRKTRLHPAYVAFPR
jgi:hypothetical protein